MNTILLLQASTNELRLILQDLQQQIKNKNSILQQENSASNRNIMLAEEIKLLEGEIIIVNGVISYKENKNISSQQVEMLKEENVKLKLKLSKHKALEQDIIGYIKSQGEKQQNVSQRHSVSIINKINEVSKLREQYSNIRSYDSSWEKLLGWICHRSLDSNTSKAKVRNKQISFLEELANMLSTGSASRVAEKDFTSLLIQISLKIGLGFQEDAPQSAEEITLDDTEKQDLISVMKALTMYGGVSSIESQIASESNTVSSRLSKLITPIKKQLQLDIYNLSDGLINEQVLSLKANEAYNYFTNGIEYLKPSDKPKPQVSMKP